jgi:hypothetical protein
VPGLVFDALSDKFYMYLEELFDNIALNEIKLRDDLSQSVGDLSLVDRNWDDLLQVFSRPIIAGCVCSNDSASGQRRRAL